jgi:hypothetical protein
MQYKALFVLSLFGATMAAPIEAVVNAVGATQDLVTITSSFTAVESALTALDTAVKGLAAGGDAKAAAAGIVAKSKAVEDALKDGTTKIGATSAITLTEALQVQSASTKLTSLTTQTVNDLISKKDIITAAGETKTTLDSLTAQKAASDAFVKAIAGKVPSAVQSVAAAASKSVGDAITKGISAFGGSA